MIRRVCGILPRRGMTTSESVAAFVAVVAGVGIGLAVLRPDLVQSIIDDANPSQASDHSVVATADEPAGTAATEDPVLAELRRLREEVRTLRESPPAVDNIEGRTLGGGAARTAKSAQRGQTPMGRRTLAYWNRLNEIMAREEEMRSVPSGGLTAANAGDFLRRRGAASSYARDAIRDLPTAGVDPEVVRHAGDIAAWYARGNELNSTGSFLLNDADDATRKGEAGTAWGESEKHHHKSVGDLNRRGDELREELTQRYGIEFPDLL